MKGKVEVDWLELLRQVKEEMDVAVRRVKAATWDGKVEVRRVIAAMAEGALHLLAAWPRYITVDGEPVAHPDEDN